MTCFCQHSALLRFGPAVFLQHYFKLSDACEARTSSLRRDLSWQARTRAQTQFRQALIPRSSDSETIEQRKTCLRRCRGSAGPLVPFCGFPPFF